MPKRTGQSPEQAEGSARIRIAPLLLIAVALVLLLAAALPLVPALAVSDARTGRPLLALPIEKGEAFYLRYTHSVNLSDVTDGMEWNGETIMVRSTLFKAYGVGMPVLADGIGNAFANTPDGFLITGIDRPESEILLLTQEVPNNRLLYRDREINLLSRCGSGTLLRIRVICASFLFLMLYRE